MIDWSSVESEVAEYLRDLLRINTTNPPGNETLAAQYIADVLARGGFEPNVTESAPGRGNVTTRYDTGDQESPLLLLGHTDVVATEPKMWSHDPFGGDLDDGYIWGRGALDMKNMVAAELMVMLLLRRESRKLNRPILFAATADEEAGKGDHGPGWLLDHYPDQIEAPVVLTEGGGHDLQIGSQRYYTCCVGQKGICRMRVTARGRPGHGSMPHDDNAVVKLCAALSGFDGGGLRIHPSKTLRTYLDGIAKHQSLELANKLRAVLEPEHSDQAIIDLPLDEDFKGELRSLLRNTASLTMLNAGSKINVIPSEATVSIDGRLVPGQTDESFIVELRQQIGDELEIQVDQYSPPLEADPEGEFYGVIEQVMDRFDPGVPVIPSLMTGGTDAKHICPRRPNTQVYGFMPYRQQPGLEEMRLIHGHDERTSVANLLFATRVIYDIVIEYGSS